MLKSAHERASAPAAPVLLPRFSRILHLVHTRDSHCSRHRHAGDFEIVAVEKGLYHTRINDTPLVLSPSQILVVKPGDWHEDFFKKGLEFHTLYFRLESAWLSPQAALLFRTGVQPALQKSTVSRSLFIPLFQRIQQEAEKSDSYSANLQDALTTEFFWQLVRALGKEAVCPEIIGLSEEQRFRSGLDRLFQEHVRESFSVPDMARSLNMSESSLAHRCKEQTGQSPANAFMRFKIAQARLLLESTRTPIKEISLQFGFESPYHFSHVFKRFTGHAPSKNRMQK